MEKSWAYWDKENETEVLIPHDEMAFIVLDQLNTVKGYDERARSGIWANEVRNLSTDKLTIRNKDGIIQSGLYKDVKGSNGAKFTKSVYVMAKINGEYELANLQLSGSSLGAWFEFADEAGDLYGDVVVATKSTTEGKKGAVTYTMPCFSIITRSLSTEASKQADEMDKKLQAYLKEYFSGGAATSGGTSEHDDDPIEDEPLDEADEFGESPF